MNILNLFGSNIRFQPILKEVVPAEVTQQLLEKQAEARAALLAMGISEQKPLINIKQREAA